MTELTRKEAAAYLGVAPSTLAAYASDRTGPAYRRSRGAKGVTFYLLEDLDAWRNSSAVEVAALPWATTDRATLAKLVQELAATNKRLDSAFKALSQLVELVESCGASTAKTRNLAKQIAREVKS